MHAAKITFLRKVGSYINHTSVTSQKAALFIVTALETSDITELAFA
jgi:hypothetical protein